MFVDIKVTVIYKKASFLAPFYLQITKLIMISLSAWYSDNSPAFALIFQAFVTQLHLEFCACVSSLTAPAASGARALAVLISPPSPKGAGMYYGRLPGCFCLALVAAVPARWRHHKSTAYSWSQSDLYGNPENGERGARKWKNVRGES